VGRAGIEAHLGADQYAAELVELAALVRKFWPERPPTLLAPDANFDEAWFAPFVAAVAPAWAELSPVELLLSHHVYPLGAGGAHTLLAKALDPRKLDAIGDRLRQVARVTNQTSAWARPIVSETGGAYNSGKDGVTNGFVSGFWWNDLLGSLSKHGHSFACRQSILGGRYALLDLQAGQPAPDFYSTLLWRTLMSPKALRIVRASSWAHANSTGGGDDASAFVNASALQENSSHAASHAAAGGPPHLRAYAHCARSKDGLLNQRGGVTVLLINTASDVEVTAQIDMPADDLGSTPRFDYLLTASNGLPSSKLVALNGRTLLAQPNGSLPRLEGLRARGSSVLIPPLSFGFFVWPEANVKPCFTERQLVDEKHADSIRAGAGPRRSGSGRQTRASKRTKRNVIETGASARTSYVPTSP